MKKSYPSWSISGRTQHVRKETSPGPGTYNPHESRTNKSINFGKSHRSTFSGSTGSPGPGAYSPSVSWTSPTPAKLGKSSRPPLSVPTQSPGPANYEVRSVGEGPSYSIYGRDFKFSSEQGPGPGTYNPSYSSTFEKMPSYGLGKDHKIQKQKIQDTPGPGNYWVRNGPEGPKWVFGKEERKRTRATEAPGPGTYYEDVPTTISKRAYSLGAKRPATSTGIKSPGPGQYNPKRKEDSPTYSFSKGSRVSMNKTFTGPDPGTYEPKLPTSKASNVFGSGIRGPLANAPQSPGPGAYKPTYFQDSPSFSIFGKEKVSRNTNLPVRHI